MREGCAFVSRAANSNLTSSQVLSPSSVFFSYMRGVNDLRRALAKITFDLASVVDHHSGRSVVTRVDQQIFAQGDPLVLLQTLANVRLPMLEHGVNVAR